MPDPTENGRTEGDFLSIEDRAAYDAEQEQLPFPEGFMDGDDWSFTKLRKTGPVELTAKLAASKAVHLSGGLLDPARTHVLRVTTARIKYTVEPTYEAKDSDLDDIAGYGVTATITPGYIEPMPTDPVELIHREFADLLARDAELARTVVSELTSLVSVSAE